VLLQVLDDGLEPGVGQPRRPLAVRQLGFQMRIVYRTRSLVSTRSRWPCSTNLREPRHLPLRVTPGR
jgi:hypothetical protein